MMVTREDVLAAALPDADSDSSAPFYVRTGDVYHALAYAELIWPDYLVVRDAVFLLVGINSRQWVKDGIETLLARPDDTRPSWPEIVDRFSWFETPYLFGFHPDPQEWNDEATYQLTVILQQSWAARLAAAFPERTFEVRLNEPDDALTLNLSIHQIVPPLE